MVRTHIQLREDQAAAIERLAHARSVSMAALIRDAVYQYVEREAVLSLDDRWQRSLAGVGGFRSGGRAYRRRTTSSSPLPQSECLRRCAVPRRPAPQRRAIRPGSGLLTAGDRRRRTQPYDGIE